MMHGLPLAFKKHCDIMIHHGCEQRWPSAAMLLLTESDYWLGFFFILDVVSTITLVLDLTWAQASAADFQIVGRCEHLGGQYI